MVSFQNQPEWPIASLKGPFSGPKNYTLYTKPVGAICKKHGLNHHFYADDSQLYMTFKPKDLNSRQKALQKIE